MMNDDDKTVLINFRDVIDFSFLRGIFKAYISLNRNITNPIRNISLDGKRMKQEYFDGIDIDYNNLHYVEHHLQNMERSYFYSISLACKDAWPIIFKRNIIEISRYYEIARYHVILESSWQNKEALQICARALSIVCDVIEEFCPEKRDKLFSLMPKYFFSDEKIENPKWSEYEKILEQKKSFSNFKRIIIEKNFTDGSGKWVFLSDQESEPSGSLFYGSLCYFTKMMMIHFGIIESMNDNVFQWEKCISIFPNLKEKDPKFLSNQLDRFRNKTPKKDQHYKNSIDDLFKTMSREMEISKSFSIS